LGNAQTSHNITTSGLSFIPDTINCNVGDSITFVLSSNHNAVEVDQFTFNRGVALLYFDLATDHTASFLHYTFDY